ncbi:unnamed protein product [Bursaphelenchus xylophilus]|uniref:(pine wood nematode) hypothetical protein n=1 Tax=Bursaphelenchus xylophilus TaxID=6326 RepID=A0A1I7S7T0_BURXY|nr:unnamed protein product [Bursaphelenchus xylophilus]CAG9086962.1 unnamed protein product [Bursaphelenchus xylophilus]
MGVILDESELPSVSFLAFYKTFEYVCFGVSVVMVFGTMGIMVLSSPKSLSKYRWYLIHEMIWSLIFDWFGTFIGAIPLYPAPCYYGENLTKHLNGDYQKAYFFGGITAVAGKICSIVFQFEHRFYQTQSTSSAYRIFCTSIQGKGEVIVRAGVTLVIVLAATLPFFVMFPDQSKARSELSALDPLMSKIFQEHPNTLCFSSYTNTFEVLIIASGLIVGVMIFSVVLIILMYISIRRNRFSSNTYRLQMMLFWSLVAQTTIFLTFMGIPGLIFSVAPLIGIRNLPRYCAYGFLFLLTHTPLDCVMILYFIKPYRIVLVRWLPSSLRTISHRASTSTNHTNNGAVKPILHRF